MHDASDAPVTFLSCNCLIIRKIFFDEFQKQWPVFGNGSPIWNMWPSPGLRPRQMRGLLLCLMASSLASQSASILAPQSSSSLASQSASNLASRSASNPASQTASSQASESASSQAPQSASILAPQSASSLASLAASPAVDENLYTGLQHPYGCHLKLLCTIRCPLFFCPHKIC